MTDARWRRAVAESATVPPRVRTRLGRAAAARKLESLELALVRKGWRCLRLYSPAAGPRLWVYAGSGAREVGTLVTVRAVRGGGWSYHRTSDGRRSVPCGDLAAAAELLDRHLKHKLYPGTFPALDAGGWVHADVQG
ncbi:hypothetical protein GCM10010182_66010 [Actinomadura cremea]|nr:hypothetical protein GCM10010182_66010 [Actinomadura cremea]